MSWSYMKIGKAGKLASIVREELTDLRGAVPGSAEELVKNKLSDVLFTLLDSLPADKVVKFNASGSASHQDGNAQSQNLTVQFETVYNFTE